MIEIDNQRIVESGTEYAVEIDKGKLAELLVECDTLAEAEQYAKMFEAEVLERHVYVTGWYPRAK